MRTINLGQAGYGHRAPITSVDITRSGNRVITGLGCTKNLVQISLLTRGWVCGPTSKEVLVSVQR